MRGNNSMPSSLFHDLILHGEDLFHTGYMHEALQVFESVIAEEPQNMLALNNRGVILHRLGMYAAAEQTFLDILRQDDANANAVVNLGSMYIEQYNMHNTEELLGRYGKCLSIQDINEFKEKLHKISQEIQTFNISEKTKILRVSMDVHAKNHAFESYLNEQEPTHRVMCACFANNALYQPGLSTIFASVLRDKDCFIDIGAHIGYFSLLGATLVGCHGQVFAFEPEEKNYRYLHDNIALNNFTHVQAFSVALGLENKTSKIFINADNDAGHALWNIGRHPDYVKSRLHCSTRDVRIASLDSLLHGANVSDIRLINIDTWGAEFDIIQGAVSTIEDKKVPYVVCGINRFGLQQMGTSEQELRQFMGYMGYATYWIRAEAPHLVSLAPEQSVESDQDLHVLFANPAWLGEDNIVPLA